MNYSSIAPASNSIPQLIANAGLPCEVTFSPRLREQFDLPDDGSDHAWLDLIWAVRCTLTGCLPAIEFSSAKGRVQISEFHSIANNTVEPINRRIAVIHQNSKAVHVVLPEEIATKIVLVVEDDSHVGEMAQHLINHLGVETILASDGQSGWHEVQRHSPAVVITDVDMPGLNGLELCRRIKANKHTKEIPVLVWSGDPSHEHDARQCGAIEFVTKPVEVGWLLQFLRGLLAG